MPSAFPDRLEAVVFDLDGTLIDSAPDLRAALNRLLAEEGRRPLALDEVTQMIGDGVPKLVERGFRATGETPEGAAFEAVVRRFHGHYEGHAADATRPYDGAIEVLDELRAAGRKLGICTNKPERATREILDSLGMARFFRAVAGGDTIEGVRKPDPRHLLAVLDALGAEPGGAVFVGDNANDVGAARNAGLPVIVMSFGYSRGPAADLGADALVDSFEDLPAALAALAARALA